MSRDRDAAEPHEGQSITNNAMALEKTNLFTAELGLLASLEQPRTRKGSGPTHEPPKRRRPARTTTKSAPGAAEKQEVRALREAVTQSEYQHAAPRPSKAAAGDTQQEPDAEDDDEGPKKIVLPFELHKPTHTAFEASTRITRLNESRRQRHIQAKENFEKVRDAISKELETEVGISTKTLKAALEKNTRELDVHFQRMHDDAQLMEMELADFEAIWTTVGASYEERAQMLHESCEQLDGVEGRRKEMVQAALTDLVNVLADIGHALLPVIEREMEPHVEALNLEIIANNGSYLELKTKLMKADLREKERLRLDWEARRADWRKLRYERAFRLFTAEVAEKRWTSPQDRRDIMDSLIKKQREVEQGVLRQLAQLVTIRPPYITADDVAKIAAEFDSLRRQAGDIADEMLQAWKESMERHAGKLDELIERLKAEIIGYAYKEAEEVETDIANDARPLADAILDADKALMAAVEEVLNAEDARLHQKVYQVGVFWTELAKKWRVFVEDVQCLEEDKTEAINVRRDEYETQIKELEGSLGELTESLRRAPTMDRLKELFVDLNGSLGDGGTIEKSHRVFNQESVEIAKSHEPALVTLVVKRGGEIMAPLGVGFPAAEAAAGDEADAAGDGDAAEQGADAALDATLASGSGRPYALAMDPDALVERITAPKQPEADGDAVDGEGDAAPEADAANDEEQGDAPAEEEFVDPVPRDEDGFACVAFLELPLELLSKGVADMRQSALAAIETVETTEGDRCREECGVRVAKLADELDHELRMHRPRLPRAESDVYFVREKELAGNAERWERHTRRVQGLLDAAESHTKELEERAAARGEAYRTARDAAITAVKAEGVLPALYGLNKRYRNETQGCKDDCAAIVDALKKEQTSIDTQVKNAQRQFLEMCEKESCYVPEEVELYSQQAEKVGAAAAGYTEQLTGRIEAVAAAADETLSSKEFPEVFHSRVEEVSMLNGLGQKYGAPKREALSRARGEYLHNTQVMERIEVELRSLEQVQATKGGWAIAHIPGMLRSLDALRRIFKHRGEYLECLQKEIECCDVTYNVANDDEAVKPEEPREKYQATMAEVDKKLQADILTLVKEYYSQPNVDAAGKDASSLPPALAKFVSGEQTKAARKLREYREALIASVIRLQNLTPHLPAVAFAHVADGLALVTAKRAAGERQRFRDEYNALKLGQDLECLKPGLGHPTGKARLDTLIEREDKRFGDSVALISKNKESILEATYASWDTFCATTGHLSEQLMALVDTTVLKDDIDPACDTAENTNTQRKGLKTLMQRAFRADEAAKAEPSFDGADPTRSRYPVVPYPAVEIARLRPAPQGDDEDKPPEEDAAAATTGEVKGFNRSADRAVIARRDHAYEASTTYHTDLLRSINEEFDQCLNAEEVFHANFTKIAKELQSYQ